MVGDGGQIFTGLIKRRDGKLRLVIPVLFRGLRSTEGVALPKPYTDSEDIALAPQGGFYVSFEGPGRVWYYSDPEAPARPLPDYAPFHRLRGNAALEALAISSDGTLYTLPELRPGAWSFPVWRFRDGAWSEYDKLPASGGWLPVGADFDADDRLYLLERRAFGPLGFQSRVRRFEIGAEGLTGETTLLSTPLRMHGNLEGIAVWRGADGDLRLTMVTDRGFGVSDKETFVEYRLHE